METIKSIGEEREKTITDSLIDGLAAGIIAGLGMGVVLILLGWAVGENPATTLNSFVPWENPTPLVGGLLHLAVSSVYGMAFGGVVFGFHRMVKAKIPVWVLGLIYGFLLFLVARFVVLPGALSGLEWVPAWLLVLSHLVYGGLLGWWMQRQANG